eukprot:1161975-Pelagomonas_calceolata.AAC.12
MVHTCMHVVCRASGENSGEEAVNAFDGGVLTKWLDFGVGLKQRRGSPNVQVCAARGWRADHFPCLHHEGPSYCSNLVSLLCWHLSSEIQAGEQRQILKSSHQRIREILVAMVAQARCRCSNAHFIALIGLFAQGGGLGGSAWLEFRFMDPEGASAQTSSPLLSYDIVSANDSPERDPRDWVVEGLSLQDEQAVFVGAVEKGNT